MDLRCAKHRMKLPFISGHQDKFLSLDPLVQNEDEEGLYDFLCLRGNVASSEDEPDYALIADDSPPALKEPFCEQTIKSRTLRIWMHHSGVISFSDNCVWCRGSLVEGKGLPSNGNVFDLNNPAQMQCRCTCEPGERASLEGQIKQHSPEVVGNQDILDWDSDGAGNCVCTQIQSNHSEVETKLCCVCSISLTENKDVVAQNLRWGRGGEGAGRVSARQPAAPPAMGSPRQRAAEPRGSRRLRLRVRRVPAPRAWQSWSRRASSRAPERLEIEAKEACDWLRAAGFPQYAQLYEALLFPIDITSVKTDHSFLDEDSLTSLCRRLMTLNTCATMKLEVRCEQKQNEDSDEDACAISNRWTFQKDSKRWSRIGSVESLSHSSEVLNTVKEASSHESVLTDLSTNVEAASLHSNTSTGSTGDTLCSVVTMPDLSPNQDPAVITFTSSTQSLTDKSQDQTGSSKDKLKKRRSRSFLRRIESFRRKKKEKTDSRPKEATSDETATEPECDSVEANGDIIAAKTTSLRQRMSPSLLDKNLFLSGGDGVDHVSDLKGSKTGCQLKHSGVDLEQCRKVLVNGTSSSIRESHQWHSYSDYLIHIPADHKPGTFPKSLSIESLCHLCDRSLTNWTSGNKAREFSEFSLDDSSSGSADSPQMSCGSRQRRNSCSSISSIMSVYDNVPQCASSKEQLDSVLDYVLHLVERVDSWYQAIIPTQDSEAGRREKTDSGGEVDRKEKTDLGREAERKVNADPDGEAERKEEMDSGEEPAFMSSLNLEKQSMSDVGTSTSDFGSTGHSLNEAEEIEMRERRDSGVGASLTRPCRKLRWCSFQNSQPRLDSASLEINCQSSAQLNLLQKCSLLRLTAIMEKDSMSPKHAWTWTVPKFMKRSKTPDYKDKMVFGVSLMITVQRTGQPLPRGIQQAMLYIRSKCLDQVGIFRKSGSKSRIQALRDMNEASPNNVNYDGQSAYDVADMLKQYFRDLPEPIFTSKLTDTFLQIYQFVPAEQRLQAVQAAILLMPDANREVLQALLYFLSEIASVEVNQMTPRNLAVCLAPSIFHLNVSSSPRVAHKKGPMGKPDQKELDENMAATQGLCHMITDCKKLFQIPKDMMLQLCNSYLAADACALPQAEPTHQNVQGECKDLQIFLDDSMQSLLKESSEKFKGWLSTPGPQNTEISCKKVGDGHPLRLWRVFTEVEAPPNTVLYRILRERHLWDKDLLQSNVIETLENNMEIYHYITGSMPPQPHRDFILFRKWHTDLPQGTCLLVSTSMNCEKLKVEGGVRAMVLTSQYLIEPCGMGRSKLTHICRADLRGRSPDWYNKTYGHICAIELARIRDSFPTLSPSGPETMV